MPMPPLASIFRAVYGVLTEGQEGEVAIDNQHRLIVVGAGSGGITPIVAGPVSVDSSTALETSSVSSIAPATFFAFNGRIDSSTPSGTYYIQLLKATSLPPDGAVTFIKAPIKVQHTNGFDSQFVIDCSSVPLPSSPGIVWCISTSEFTKTLAVGTFVSGDLYFNLIT